jgi:hypothetical protein
MKKTTDKEIEEMRLSLFLLKLELDGYIRGDWYYEYHMTIGYNKKFTGKKILRLDKSEETE